MTRRFLISGRLDASGKNYEGGFFGVDLEALFGHPEFGVNVSYLAYHWVG